MELHAQCIYKDPLPSWMPRLHTRRTEASPRSRDRKKSVANLKGGISAITENSRIFLVTESKSSINKTVVIRFQVTL